MVIILKLMILMMMMILMLTLTMMTMMIRMLHRRRRIKHITAFYCIVDGDGGGGTYRASTRIEKKMKCGDIHTYMPATAFTHSLSHPQHHRPRGFYQLYLLATPPT